jgi:hypothetical protein
LPAAFTADDLGEFLHEEWPTLKSTTGASAGARLDHVDLFRGMQKSAIFSKVRKHSKLWSWLRMFEWSCKFFFYKRLCPVSKMHASCLNPFGSRHKRFFGKALW